MDCRTWRCSRSWHDAWFRAYLSGQRTPGVRRRSVPDPLDEPELDGAELGEPELDDSELDDPLLDEPPVEPPAARLSVL